MPRLKRSKFMFNHRSKHPALVYDDLGKEYGYISITHSKKTHNVKNIELKENFNREDKLKSYILPYPKKDKKKVFTNEKTKMVIGSKNRRIIEKVKKRPYK
ncbi:hypothetical protein [Acholeplasma hippikon]|uniref:Uncharacterized protein n=1 Tax=Acholeplasma hippikon TaxID=264636 RepID=A0A449BK99_9MOLU|nr:hypothetical protein [Acholeplasma hippikon]VEU82757.1 Uncharacterised protein [Acholeplasma hippikon]